jgi:hypothetical protein
MNARLLENADDKGVIIYTVIFNINQDRSAITLSA